jgi:reverse gyrase
MQRRRNWRNRLLSPRSDRQNASKQTITAIHRAVHDVHLATRSVAQIRLRRAHYERRTAIYEASLITYMRTDGIDAGPEAITAARNAVAAKFGKDYVS